METRHAALSVRLSPTAPASNPLPPAPLVPSTAANTESPESPASAAPSAAAVAIEAKVRRRVLDRLGPERFERYFGSGATLHVTADGSSLAVDVADRMLAGMYDRQFRAVLTEALRAESGRDLADVRFVVDAPAIAPPIASAPASSRATGDAAILTRTDEGGDRGASEAAAPHRAVVAPPRRRVTTAARRPGLEHFVVGPCNALAYEAARRTVEGDRTPVYIHGPCGMGKTHLLSAIASAAAKRGAAAGGRLSMGASGGGGSGGGGGGGGGGGAKYVSAEGFANAYIGAVRLNKVDALRRTYRSLDVLCIDEIQALAGKPATQQELQHTLDAIAQRGGRIVIGGAAHPRALAGLSDALVSRLMAGMVAAIGTPDTNTLARAARALAARRGLGLDEEAATALVQTAGAPSRSSAGMSAAPGETARSIRDIEGLVTKVEAVQRLLSPRGMAPLSPECPLPIGAAAVRRALATAAPARGSAGAGPARPVRFERIVAAVCEMMMVEAADLAGKGRHERVVLARALCAHLARRLTTLSFPEIARGLGRTSHSTIITAAQRLSRQIAAGHFADLGPVRGEMRIAEICETLARDIIATAA